jgi:hypothetical protein
LLDPLTHLATNSTATTIATATTGPDPALTLTAAIVSAVVAFAILGLDRFLIEPRKWRVRYVVRQLEKSVQLHAWLVSVLRACQEKAKRTPDVEAKLPHLLESDDVRKLEDIFEKNAYFLSSELKQTWYDAQRKDTTFLFDAVKHRDKIGAPTVLGSMEHRVVSIDLTEMQNRAETEVSFVIQVHRNLTRFAGLKALTKRELPDLYERYTKEMQIDT